MNDTKDILPIEPPNVALQRLEAIAGEHFDDYLLVVTRRGYNKESQVWHTFSTAHAGNGLASFVSQKVNRSWWVDDKPLPPQGK